MPMLERTRAKSGDSVSSGNTHVAVDMWAVSKAPCDHHCDAARDRSCALPSWRLATIGPVVYPTAKPAGAKGKWLRACRHAECACARSVPPSNPSLAKRLSE